MTFFSSRVIGRGAASDRGVATAVAIECFLPSFKRLSPVVRVLVSRLPP
jgi:hypothetical protein